jgi:HlyD family secretion protein
MKNFIANNKRVLLFISVIVVLVAIFIVTSQDINAAAKDMYQTEVAARGNISAVVGATGTVRAVQSATLTWETSGIVETVNVKLGDTVSGDEVLASLIQSSLSQNIILAEADLVSAEQALDDLLNSSTDQANAVIALREAQDAYDDAVEYRESLEGKIDIQYVVWVNGQPKAKYRKGYADEEEKAKVDEDVALKKGQLEDAQRAYDRLKDGPNEQDIAAAEARVAAAKATLNQAIITAPFSGVITDASVLPGDQVAMGELAFEVDDISHLQIDVEVSEVDINSVSVGQEVTVNFDAVQNKDYFGEVVSVAGSGVETAGSVNFKVTVEITDVDEQIKPGMTAAVLIQVRNVEDALLVPNRAVRVVDGERVVYVLGEDGTLTTGEVRLGATSDTYSEVVGGDLEEGDTIVLNPPAIIEFGPGSSGGPGGGGLPR